MPGFTSASPLASSLAPRNCLEAMGYPQPPTPAKAASSAASGITSATMKQKHPKATGMRVYWLKDRAQQGQLSTYWGSGKRAPRWLPHNKKGIEFWSPPHSQKIVR